MSASSARAEAAAWLARLRSDERTAADEAGFRAWLADDPAHREAFDALNQVWEVAGGLASERRRELARRPARAPDRRGLIAAGLGVAAVGALGGWQVAFAGVYSTAVGEQRRVALDDGSLVILDTDTKIRVDFNRDARRIALLRGRAHFQVAKDVARPFVVAAAEQQVVAVGTAFDVSRRDQAVAVVVTEGQVAVRLPDAPTRLVTPGRRVVIGQDAAPREDAPDLARVTAWQAGKAVFDDEPVAAAIAEMNRYSRRPIVLADPQAGQMRVSGVYSTGDTEAFARSLAALLPLEVSIEPERVTLSAADAQKTS